MPKPWEMDWGGGQGAPSAQKPWEKPWGAQGNEGGLGKSWDSLAKPEEKKEGGLVGAWNSLLDSSYIKGSVEGLKSAAREIPQEIGRFAGDVGQSLLPGRGGAEAGGRVLGKLGDVGTFATGGLAGTMGVPRPPNVGPRGIDVPRPTQMPRPATEGAPPVAPSKPVEPLIPPGAERGEPSSFASALVKNDPAPIDRALTARFRQGIRPGRPDQKTAGGERLQDQRITTAVDSIIDAKDIIRLKTPEGAELPAGRLPRNLDEFTQAIEQLKDHVFDEYDNMAKRIGGQGVRVPLAPAVARLRELAAEPQVRDLHPEMLARAEATAQRWEQVGSYSPKVMQNVVQSLNKELETFQRNPTRETPTYNAMMNQVLHTMRGNLNEAMETALQGPQYQGLRSRYSSLASIEADVTNALHREGSKQPGLLDKATDMAFWAGAAHGLFTVNPKTAGAALSLKGVRELQRYLRSPNRAVSKLFSNRERALYPPMTDVPPVTDWLSAGAGAGLSDQRERHVSPVGP